jgi:hypothetical protein
LKPSTPHKATAATLGTFIGVRGKVLKPFALMLAYEIIIAVIPNVTPVY